MSALQKIMRLMLIEKKDISVAVVCGFIAGISSVGLFAASGYLISKSALIPPFYTLIILTSTVKLLGLVKAGAKYGERLSSHRATFTILSNLRVAFFEKLTPLIPQIFHKYRSGPACACSWRCRKFAKFLFKSVLPTACALTCFCQHDLIY